MFKWLQKSRSQIENGIQSFSLSNLAQPLDKSDALSILISEKHFGVFLKLLNNFEYSKVLHFISK